mgnify:FL=1
MVKVSIIIPVYNAEKFIAQRIESFKRQTLSDYELILVNDCSPDSSLSVIKKCAEGNSKIRIIDLAENGGPMCARFEGCNIANGEYITFCDSDDELPDDALEMLYKEAKATKSDIVAGTIDFIKISDGSHSLWKSSLKYGSDQIAAMKSLLKNEYRHNVVGKLIKRELLQQYQYSNVKGLRYYEDFVLMYELVQHASKFVCINNVVYNYIQTEGSSTMLNMSSCRLDNIAYAHSLVFQLVSNRFPALMKLCYGNFQKRFISLLVNYRIGPKELKTVLGKYKLDSILNISNIFKANSILDSIKLSVALMGSPLIAKIKK